MYKGKKEERKEGSMRTSKQAGKQKRTKKKTEWSKTEQMTTKKKKGNKRRKDAAKRIKYAEKEGTSKEMTEIRNESNITIPEKIDC